MQQTISLVVIGPSNAGSAAIINGQFTSWHGVMPHAPLHARENLSRTAREARSDGIHCRGGGAAPMRRRAQDEARTAMQKPLAVRSAVPRPTPGRRAIDRRRARLALLLSTTAGFVDAVGWLELSHVYTANMTGNTVDVGRGLALFDLAEVALRAWPIGMFVAGLLISSLVFEAGRRRRARRTPALVLALEAALLLAFAASGGRSQAARPGGASFYLLVALPCVAMGLQNATLTRVGALTVRTTHVTGTLSRMAGFLAEWVVSAYDRLRGTGSRPRRASARKALLLFGLWSGYVAGATAGVVLLKQWLSWALAFPAVALFAAAAVAALHPYAATRAHE
jgi:uncharacterized membrane protein YoaK (UPF0700 family)